MLLDEFAPQYGSSERHSVSIQASRETVLNTLKEVRFCDSLLFTLLLGVRSLPIRLKRKSSSLLGGLCDPIFEWATRSGFTVLAEKKGEEIVFGMIGQFWKPFGGVSPRIIDARDFLRFARPGFAKVATNFPVHEEPNGSMLVTETRVLATDATSEKKFGEYWKMIRSGSSLIRREWLRAIKTKSERADLPTVLNAE